MTVPSTTSFRSAPPTARAALTSAIGAVEFAEVDEQDARREPERMRRNAASSVSVDGELVIQLQLADDPLDAIDRRLLVEDGEDALALGFERSRSAQ